MPRRRRLARPAVVTLLALLPLLLTAACTSASHASPAVSSRTWHPVDAGPLAPSSALLDVAAIEPPGGGWPWVIAGDSRTGEFPAVGFWTSPDGASWQGAETKGLTLDAPQSLVFSIARRGDVAIALGETPGMAHGNPRPTIWRSTDGGHWSEVPTLREDFGGPYLTDLRAVAAGPLGFVVVGNWKTPEGRPVIAVWLSVDGLHWVRHDNVAQLTSVGGEELTAMDVAAGPGGVAIVGESYAPAPGRADRVVGFIAVSPDGVDWTRVPADRGGLDNGGQVAIRAIAAEGASFVAVGSRSRGPRNELSAWQPAGTGRWGVTTIAQTPFPRGTAIAVDATTATVWAAVAADGSLSLWQRGKGKGKGWRRANAPSAAGGGSAGNPSTLDSVVLAASSGRLLVSAQAGTRSRLWSS